VRPTRGAGLRFHSDAVNAVVFLQDGAWHRWTDAQIAIWTAGRQQPDEVFEGHRAPIAGLAVSPDGSMLASASGSHRAALAAWFRCESACWRATCRNVQRRCLMPDGKSLVSVGYDLTLRSGRCRTDRRCHHLTSPLNAVAIAPDGEIATAVRRQGALSDRLARPRQQTDCRPMSGQMPRTA